MGKELKTVLISLPNSENLLNAIAYFSEQDYQVNLANPLFGKNFVDQLAKKIQPDQVIIEESEAFDQRKFIPQDYTNKISILSSGTIKAPRFYTFNFQDLYKQAIDFVDFFKLNQSRYLITLPIASMGGVNLLLRALASNSEFVLSDLNQVKDFKETTLSLVPSQLRVFKDKCHLLTKADKIYLGGEVIDDQTMDLVRQFQLPVTFTYAMTETAGTLATRNVQDVAYQKLPGVDFKLSSEKQLLVKSALFADQVETDNQYYLSNDFAELNNSGDLVKVWRDNRNLNSGGVKISLNDLESTILQSSNLTQVACIKVADQRFGEAVECFYVGEEEPGLPIQGMPEFVKPKFLRVESIPVTQAGKIDYRALENHSHIKYL